MSEDPIIPMPHVVIRTPAGEWGNCPVQAEGTINGEEFYFHARGEHWSMSIGGEDVVMHPLWHCWEKYSDDTFGAGWMTEEEARGFLDKAIYQYLKDRP